MAGKTKRIDYKPAQAVMGLAVREAKRFKHGYLDTEHILLALVAESNSAVAKALSDIGLTPGKIRAGTEFVVGYGDRDPEKVKLTPRAERVINFALEEAHRLKSPHCGAEHLLLGILSETGGVAAGILDSMVGEELLDRMKDSIADKVKGSHG